MYVETFSVHCEDHMKHGYTVLGRMLNWLVLNLTSVVNNELWGINQSKIINYCATYNG